jgi:hypothetical protein
MHLTLMGAGIYHYRYPQLKKENHREGYSANEERRRCDLAAPWPVTRRRREHAACQLVASTPLPSEASRRRSLDRRAGSGAGFAEGDG